MIKKMKLRDIAGSTEHLTCGHRLCTGCAEPVIVRQVLHAAENPVVVANATGCLEVATTIYPYTAWKVPWIHSAFENTAATISGVESAYRALKRKGKIDKKINFIAFAGDGGTYDIGLQSLSGALERGHAFLYVCLDNEAYMNTGIQRSSSTPRGSWTTTTPVGEKIVGKPEYKKDITEIIAAHGIPYVAQTAPSHWMDLMTKVKKALKVEGPTFINVSSPCPRGWRSEPEESMRLSRLAVETCYWPLYEVENGVWKINLKPKKKPIEEYLAPQKRFAHLLKPQNKHIVEDLQRRVDERWETLQWKAEVSQQRSQQKQQQQTSANPTSQ
ncbi:MAG: pyruvate ferredoxin oxidoreductase [Thaumarchaeota archaeon]|nr:pyruvate ferredoxin oxidoreductase [Nitrososphaerota archaeon]